MICALRTPQTSQVFIAMPDQTPAGSADQVNVEVAYALPDTQRIVQLSVEAGCTAMQAAQRSGLAEQFGLDLEQVKMGVFGKAVKPLQYQLAEGDRVELYRPLLVDPKASRKERAQRAKAEKSGG